MDQGQDGLPSLCLAYITVTGPALADVDIHGGLLQDEEAIDEEAWKVSVYRGSLPTFFYLAPARRCSPTVPPVQVRKVVHCLNKFRNIECRECLPLLFCLDFKLPATAGAEKEELDDVRRPSTELTCCNPTRVAPFLHLQVKDKETPECRYVVRHININSMRIQK